MKTQKYQLHLASTVTLAEPVMDGDKVKTPGRKLDLPSMSGRVVRFRAPLGVVEHDELEKQALEIIGKDATQRESALFARRYCLMSMIYQVSIPTADPAQLKPSDFIDVKTSDMMLPVGPKSWGELFTVADTVVLGAEYNRWHDFPIEALDMLVGKALPVASED